MSQFFLKGNNNNNKHNHMAATARFASRCKRAAPTPPTPPTPPCGFEFDPSKNSFFGTDEGMISTTPGKDTGSLIYGQRNLPGSLAFAQTPPLTVVSFEALSFDDPLKDKLVLRTVAAEIVNSNGDIDTSRLFPEQIQSSINSFLDATEVVIATCTDALKEQFGPLSIDSPTNPFDILAETTQTILARAGATDLSALKDP